MAKIPVNTNEKVFTVDKWLGVNECPDGDMHLKMGELAAMSNFRITDDGSLKKRPGTANVAGLVSAYSVDVSETATTVTTDLNTATTTFSCYPSIGVTAGGILSLSGTPVTVTYANHATYAGYYYEKDGLFYKLSDVVYTQPSEGTLVTGGSVSISGSHYTASPLGEFLTAYTDVAVLNGTVIMTGTSSAANWSGADVGKYFVSATTSIPYKLESFDSEFNTYSSATVTYVADDTYEWDFFPVTATTESEDIAVRDIWSGYVNGSEMMCAACNGRLWGLTVADNVWTKTNLGSLTTTGTVHMFGFDNKLYILDGENYRVFAGETHTEHTYTADGTEADGDYYITVDTVNYKFTIAEAMTEGDEYVFSEYDLLLKCNVETVSTTTGAVTTETDLTAGLVESTVYDPLQAVVGYRPLILTATAPTGAGTALEDVNKLNGLRKVWFSATGAATVFQLPETGLTSIDWVKNLTSGSTYTLTSDYTVSTENGTVTFGSAPAEGTDNIEIAYTASTIDRAAVIAMKYSELYNGTNDNRVCLYGDGSNEIFYSGLDYNGEARADYFPDLNEIAVGDSTPITDVIRHYDRLLAFKEDAAYSIYYGTMSQIDGSVIASFYVSPVNRDIGNAAEGQVRIVENRPRTLDGNSIYEWKATSTSGNVTGDQRNSQVISQRIGQTLSTFSLPDTKTYFDKIHHEYYVFCKKLHEYETLSAGWTYMMLVNNTENDTWYIYEGIPATCMINYLDELYIGTTDGYIKHLSDNYLNDAGAAIEVYAETGSMDFGAPFKRKYSANVWLGIKPEANGAIRLTAVTDQSTGNGEELATTTASGLSVSGFFSFLDLDFTKLSFNVNEIPTIDCHKLKAKKFIYYKLVFSSNSTNTTATITNASIRVRYTGNVR